MAITNQFLKYATGGGANVPTQSSYVGNPQTGIGQQPGVASSAFNNKALRQANSIASQFAQFLANFNNTDVLDNLDAAPTQLLSSITAALDILTPDINVFTAGSGTFNPKYYVYCAAANATSGATYSDGTTTFTIPTTISAATKFIMSGPAAPATGTGALVLTKLSGTGDATISYYAVRAPIRMKVKAVGGGSGGGSTGAGAVPTAGTSTTFGGVLTAGGASAPASNGFALPGNGGSASLTTSATVIQRRLVVGGRGTPFVASVASFNEISGGDGAPSSYAGWGGGGGFNQTGQAASGPGSGGGGQGGANNAGTGGSAGGEVEADFLNPTSSYAYSIGTKGLGGNTSASGGDGQRGQLELELQYQ